MFAISPDILFSAALHLLSAEGVFGSAYFMIYMLKFSYYFLAYTVYANAFAFESWQAPSRVVFCRHMMFCNDVALLTLHRWLRPM